MTKSFFLLQCLLFIFICYQEVQPSSFRRQSDKAEGYHGRMGSPRQHSDNSGKQSDAESVEFHHWQPHPCPHGT